MTGDQKLCPFPHWTLSTRTADKRYAFLSEPPSDWFVGGLVAQSLEPWHPPGVQTTQTLHDGVDFYYNLGALVNFYCHSLSTGLGDAGPLALEYVTYSMNTNLHPRLWSANAVKVYQWWQGRSNVQITPSSSTNGSQVITTLAISGATDSRTAVEVLVPQASFYGVQVFTNGVAATGSCYRINGQIVRVLVGTSVTNAEIRSIMAPTAQNDLYYTRQGCTLAIPAPGVLSWLLLAPPIFAVVTLTVDVVPFAEAPAATPPLPAQVCAILASWPTAVTVRLLAVRLTPVPR